MNIQYYHKFVLIAALCPWFLVLLLASCTSVNVQSSGNPTGTTGNAQTAPATAATAVRSPTTVTPSDEPSPTQPAATVPTGQIAVVAGLAQVQSVDILLLESFPVQVQVVATGEFPDSCTSIRAREQSYASGTFTVTLKTQRPADALCSAAMVPFEQVIPLQGTTGLTEGTYLVVVNGITKTFELPANTAPPLP